eukprot:PITA_13817
MVEEYSSIMTNVVWEVVPRLEERSVVGSKWIYKIKYVTDDNVEKYKARFVAKGYAKKEGIHYEEIFAPIARYTSIWINYYLQQMGFVKSDTDPNLHYLMVEDEPLILVLYVDDLFLTGSSRLVKGCKRNLATEFDMKDLGLMHYFLGLEVWQKDGEILLGQGRNTTDILKRFRMHDCRPMSTPMIDNCKKIDASDDKDVDATLYRHLIESHMYLVNTRLDICFTVNTLHLFMVGPKRVHWAVLSHKVSMHRDNAQNRGCHFEPYSLCLDSLLANSRGGSP